MLSPGPRGRVFALQLALLGAAGVGLAQEPPAADSAMPAHPAYVSTPLAIARERAGSGTSWLPDATRHGGVNATPGAWDLSIHGTVFLYYDAQSGLRSADQVGSVNWVMLGAAHALGSGLVQLRGMVSAEPLTIAEPGYPQLLQVASVYGGQTVADRAHPEAPVMEAALLYERVVGSDVALSAYVAPVGEPALGPVSYLHRPSAVADPLTPLGHSAQDVTHVSYGVGTIGVFTRRVKLEGSVFNSAHPDPNAGFSYHVQLNGYSTRLIWNPGESWSISGWVGHLAASGGAHAHDPTTRLGGSALYASPRSAAGAWSAALIWGADIPVTTGRLLHTVLVESSVDFGSTTLFGRGEYVQRSAADLALIGSVPPVLDIGAVSAGCARRVATLGSIGTWLGASGTLNVVPADLEAFYGTRYPLGALLYANVRPRAGHMTR